MATPGKPLDAASIRAIIKLRAVLSVRKVAREVRVCTRTVVKYTRRPAPPYRHDLA